MKAQKFTTLVIFLFTLIACTESKEHKPDGIVTVDTTPPVISISSSIMGDGIISASESSSVVINGTTNAEDGQGVFLTVSNLLTSVELTAPVASGTWRTNPSDLSSFSDGELVIVAQVYDVAQNLSDGAVQSIILDQNSLEIGITSPLALNDTINQSEAKVLRILGSASLADGETVSLTLNPGFQNSLTANATVQDGKWQTQSIDISSFNDGTAYIVASITNQAEESSHTIFRTHLDKTITPPAPSREGTIFFNSEIMTYDDPTTYVSVTSNGQGTRTMFDRRTNSFNQEEARLFNATFSDGFTIEIQVNPEFTEAEALIEAEKYATEVGRMPKMLKRDVHTMWIHKGEELFGGGNNNILIHTETTANVYEPRGNLHETLIHEATHTSLDAYIKDDPEWLYAQSADGTFISEYARDNPNREDIAESFLLYFAYRYRPEVLSETLKQFIEEAMAYRMVYFDKQNFDLAPYDQ